MFKNKFKIAKEYRKIISIAASSFSLIGAKRRPLHHNITNPFCLLLIAYCLLAFTNSTYSTVRYVSHNGSNTPPYTTWETAADSIMFAINISVFGDTIYVANGVYEEQVIMIPGLTLIGAGLDSCVINTQSLVNSTGYVAVEVKDSCLFKGFQIIVYFNSDKGYGIAQSGNSLVTLNRITNAKYGNYVGWTGTQYIPVVYNNIYETISIGIDLFNTSAVVRKNVIYIPPNSISFAGIRIGAFDNSYSPVIDSNYIELRGYPFTAADGIYKSLGAKPIITNNVIFLKGEQNDGIFLGDSDSGWVYNNLIVATPGDLGIKNFGIQYLQLYNNYLTGNFDDGEYAIIVGEENVVKNNVVTNAKKGVRVWPNENPIFQYNNVWNNEVNYGGFTPDSTNLSVDPMVVNEDSTQGELDFHLQMFSPLSDAGDPTIFDKDSTRSDIGLYGGPFGERYAYFDLAPKPPRNLSAIVDTEYIKLTWNRNTESDFKSYSLFRDTTAGFTADSTTFVVSLTDTFYVQVIPPGIDAFYYKLTATDNQGNESNTSEELPVIITSIKEYPITVSDYRLYQNYPNPFNPSTKIGYKLKERGYVKLYVYDIKGELVSVLVNQTQEAGYYEVEFGSDTGYQIPESGIRNLASGIYIYQIMIKSENNPSKPGPNGIPVFTDMKKMLMIK